jgi:hypothetical protein
MFTLADVIVQKYHIEYEKKKQIAVPYDYRRTAIAATMGTVFMTPLFHYWFTYVLPGVVTK